MRWAILGLLMLAAPALAANDPVRVVQDERSITLDNGILSFVLDKNSGQVTSLKTRINGTMTELGQGANTIYMHFVDQDGKTEHASPVQRNMIRLVSSSADAAEVMIGTMPKPAVAFHIEWHLILRRNEPGIYAYMTYRHGKGMAASEFAQGGFVVRGVAGQTLFTHYVNSDATAKKPYPAGKVVKEVQDATWRYEDGFVQSKYDYCLFTGWEHVFGMAGNRGVGLWMIIPSWSEYENGGPLHQELTVHQGPVENGPQTNIMQWIFQGKHFGAPGVVMKADEAWSKFYGPMFIYINHGPNVEALWADAKKRTAAEEKKWPYSFIKNAEYPLVRGTVTGQVKVAGGGSVKDAWVVLSAPGEDDFCMAAKGYEFWTKADEEGRFSIAKVRPGKYRLHVSGGNQFEDFHHDGVVVSAGGKTDVGTLDWKPVTHGKTLWQIGMPDRGTAEFKRGDDVRHYDNFQRYLQDFPNDVTFTIGTSKESDDWNFCQWGWYAKKPYWSVLFDSKDALKGKATLTIGLAAADAKQLVVGLNGKELKKLDLQVSGAAIYRSGGQDSLRQVFYVPFDASLIHAGQNELQFHIPGAIPAAGNETKRAVDVRAVMYDALRLEVDDAH
jgi:rhamnogalacturonan endolyase